MSTMVTYPARSVHGREGIRIDALAHGELVRHLEERSHAEDLGEVGAHTSEHGVVEEDIALDLPSESLDGTRVDEAELGPTLREGV